MEHAWRKKVAEVVHKKIAGNIFAAFNTNVDVVVHLDKENVLGLLTDREVQSGLNGNLNADDIDTITTKEEFVTVIKDCLGKGKSFYIVLENLDLLDWLEEKFDNRKENMGGQAGIIANQMASLGAKSIVYTSLLSKKQASMFFEEVYTPVANGSLELKPIAESVRVHDQTKINWIFEYGKNVEFDFNGEKVVTPRANRVILATRPEGVKMAFQGEVAKRLPELGAKIDVAFMAGYHYAPSDPKALNDYLSCSMEALRHLKQDNPHLRLHFEYVPMKDDDAERMMLSAIAKEIQSFGINENEIKRVLQSFNFQEEFQAIMENERAYTLYQGALRIMERLGFERIQVHNLGYYVLVLKKPYVTAPEKVRNACLYASSVNAMKAKYGGYVSLDQIEEAAEVPVSNIGLDQLKGFAQEMKDKGVLLPEDFLTEGICDMGDHYVLVVPAHVIPNPVSTVGMGDTISSSSYACEFSSVQLVR